MLGRAVTGALILALASCSESTAPNGILTGAWYAGSGLPSGAYTLLRLRHTNTVITGTVTDYWGPESTVADQGTVTGTYADSVIELRLQYRTAGTVDFGGLLVGSDTLRGSETVGRTATVVNFIRQSP